MLKFVDLQSKKAKYEDFANQLEKQIRDGALKPNEALPPIRTLTKNTGLSIRTIARGLELLEKKGLTERVPHRGYFVRQDKASKSASAIKTISFITPALSWDAEEYVKGINSAIDPEKFVLSIHCTEADIEKYKNLIIQMSKLRPDGLIIGALPKEFDSPEIIEILNNLDIPITIIGTSFEGVICDRVHHPISNSGHIIGQYIKQHCNHIRNIKVILVEPLDVQGQMVNALGEELAANGIYLTENDILKIKSYHGYGKSPNPYVDSYNYMKKLLKDGFDADLLIVSHDYPAVGVLKALQEEGIKVPDNIQVISGEKCDVDNMVPIKLTTVSTQRGKLAELASRILVKRIEGYKGPCETHHIYGYLIEGQTTKRIVDC